MDVGKDVGDARSEQFPGHGDLGFAAFVLGRVMKQRGDGFVLVAAKFQNDRGNGHEMRYMRDVRARPRLLDMQAVGEG
ncbi:MAG: hypothetical protein MI741_04520, partial [Rhodospirillales bacterium]|nr:hypothetical protein [Rhodospirillales bacterium]